MMEPEEYGEFPNASQASKHSRRTHSMGIDGSPYVERKKKDQKDHQNEPKDQEKPEIDQKDQKDFKKDSTLASDFNKKEKAEKALKDQKDREKTEKDQKDQEIEEEKAEIGEKISRIEKDIHELTTSGEFETDPEVMTEHIIAKNQYYSMPIPINYFKN